MMDALGRYLLSVSGAALISGIVLGFVKDSTHHTVLKLVCGLFLMLTVIRPMVHIPLAGLTRFSLPYLEEASGASAVGEAYALNQLQLLIKQETQAYILDKATSLGANISVDVVLDTNPPYIPITVYLDGTVSPYAKKQLSDYIAEKLAIGKEAQIWTG